MRKRAITTPFVWLLLGCFIWASMGLGRVPLSHFLLLSGLCIPEQLPAGSPCESAAEVAQPSDLSCFREWVCLRGRRSLIACHAGHMADVRCFPSAPEDRFCPFAAVADRSPFRQRLRPLRC
ncbi:MAG: hypothetical protein KatS3mg110_4380 [Pirellulaceae bacterium]|nr:MAG: hypothetical protein KatS3mg110_4380 [Pirellulaceae bacterium]